MLRERFLVRVEIVVPWAALSALIKPLYTSGERGRPPIEIEHMLRIHFLQTWFNMSDPLSELGRREKFPRSSLGFASKSPLPIISYKANFPSAVIGMKVR